MNLITFDLRLRFPAHESNYNIKYPPQVEGFRLFTDSFLPFLLQQACYCGSEYCRGIIGGKHNSRKNGQVLDRAGRPVGRPPKDKRKSNYRLKKLREKVRC